MCGFRAGAVSFASDSPALVPKRTRLAIRCDTIEDAGEIPSHVRRPLPYPRAAMFGRSLDRHDRQIVSVSSDSAGILTFRDAESRIVGRLERIMDGVRPFESWWADTEGERWRIDVEGRRPDWRFSVREESSGTVTAWARRRRWRVGTYDIWMAPDRRFRLRTSLWRLTALLDESGVRVATFDIGIRPALFGRRRQGYSVEVSATPTQANVLLLLLGSRVELFESWVRATVNL